MNLDPNSNFYSGIHGDYSISANNNYSILGFTREDVSSLVREDKWLEIESYARQGKSLFVINDIRISFTGDKQSSIVDSKYLAFPLIKTALHDFVNQCIEHDSNSKLYERCVHLYITNNDEEGLRSILSKWPDQIAAMEKNIPSYLFNLGKSAVINKQNNILNVVLDFLSPSKRKELFNFVQQAGYIEFEEVFVLKEGIDEEAVKSLKNQKEWMEKVEDFFPSLKSYKLFERCLNKDHASLYGGENVQDIYQNETRKNVIYALWMMSQSEKIGSCEWFNILLVSLGNRRQSIAHLCKSEDAKYFGTKRSTSLKTPLIDSYKQYNAKVFKNGLGDSEITVKIGEIDYVLSRIEPLNDWDLGSWAVVNDYDDFWKNNDPVFEQVASIFKKIVQKEDFADEELKNDIAYFHWLFANIAPFARGSASIAEVLSDALWLFHGYVPQPIEKGLSLDLEALTNSKIESFQKLYPLGLKPQI